MNSQTTLAIVISSSLIVSTWIKLKIFPITRVGSGGSNMDGLKELEFAQAAVVAHLASIRKIDDFIHWTIVLNVHKFGSPVIAIDESVISKSSSKWIQTIQALMVPFFLFEFDVDRERRSNFSLEKPKFYHNQNMNYCQEN
ncbi:hypothetical protein RDI58_020583 [Solanum bulbocastanum]|uniref:Uncharacterized protein n=1 Tax=Solanum bulbocastanum TaxID=147425 RepID=A0AAN8Y822_SOLBU